MTETLRVGAFGAAVTVKISGLTAEQLDTLRSSWSRCKPSATTSARTAAVRASVSSSASAEPTLRSGRRITARDPIVLADTLTTRITQELIDLARRDYLLFHACALAHPSTGAVVALIGPSGRGKTTAAATLGTRLGYVTDETVAVAVDLEVHPYPKPLSVVRPESTVKTQTSPDELNLVDVSTLPPLRLAAVVLLDRRSDAPRNPTFTPMNLADAIAELVPQISYLTQRPRPLLHLADTIAQTGGIRRLSYRDAEQLHEPVRKLLSTHAAEHAPAPWAAAPIGSDATTGIRRAPIADAIADGHRMIVLHDGIVRVLDGIAPTIWNAAVGVDLRQLADSVISIHGVPPATEDSTIDALSLVRAAVNHLASVGLLIDDTRPEVTR